MRSEDAKPGVRVRLLRDEDSVSAGAVGVIRENDPTEAWPLKVAFEMGTIWVSLDIVEEVKGMRKEDVKVGMKVLVKSSTRAPNYKTRAMVGHVVEVMALPGREGQVRLLTPDKTEWWNFNLSDIEPAETPQVPSVTINGIVYVPKDTIKAPEPAPAPKFFWGQWVEVEGDERPAMVITPEADGDGDIRVTFMGSRAWDYRKASRCTPIGA